MADAIVSARYGSVDTARVFTLGLETKSMRIAFWCVGNRYRRSLPKFAVNALKEAADVKFPDLSAAVIGGSASWATLGAGYGIGIALLTYSAVKIVTGYIEKTRSPCRYLSRIHKLGETLQAAAPRARSQGLKKLAPQLPFDL